MGADGNVADSSAVVNALSVSSLSGTAAPTSSDFAWTQTFSGRGTVKAVRAFGGGDLCVLLHTDTASAAEVARLRHSKARKKNDEKAYERVVGSRFTQFCRSTFCYFQIPCFHFHITLFNQILESVLSSSVIRTIRTISVLTHIHKLI